LTFTYQQQKLKDVRENPQNNRLPYFQTKILTWDMKKTRFEFLNISRSDKDLIKKLSPDSELFYLAPLDKGLSGSITLLAKWVIGHSENLTKFHVLKIGNAEKLKKEYEAITRIAAPLIKNFPNVLIIYSDDKTRAVLSQEFIGDDEGVSLSLKQFIENTSDIDAIEKIINTLYNEEIIHWIPATSKTKEVRKYKTKTKYRDIFKDWASKGEAKGDLTMAVKEVGEGFIVLSLYEHFKIDIKNIESYIRNLYEETISIKTGPVHGDLHSQNIVLDKSNRISLIDFGWTDIRWQAVDFIWLECSLKFVVCAPYVRVEDFVAIESILNEFWGNEDAIQYDVIMEMYHGIELAKIVKGVATIRKNARVFKVVDNKEQYLKGLLIMTKSLSTFPKLNRGTLFHSLGNNIQHLQGKKMKIAPYDKLYETLGFLWPYQPGRMVLAAAEYMKSPGRCLDLGCGDGKNMLYLEKLNWKVDGVDLSQYAITAAKKRFEREKEVIKGNLILEDVVDFEYQPNSYELIVCYGLYHCLTDLEIEKIHGAIIASLKPGGLLAFATLNDNLPVPENHQTGNIYLRPENHIFGLIGDALIVLKKEIGTITESHLPLVHEHHHALTWALFKKP
jgi:SAM-dependent methyltransferase/tRNA A-37 threonylcarbamoyl transferase component Bud32